MWVPHSPQTIFCTVGVSAWTAAPAAKPMSTPIHPLDPRPRFPKAPPARAPSRQRDRPRRLLDTRLHHLVADPAPHALHVHWLDPFFYDFVRLVDGRLARGPGPPRFFAGIESLDSMPK